MTTPAPPLVDPGTVNPNATAGAGRGKKVGGKRKGRLTLQERMLRDAQRAAEGRQAAEAKQNADDVYTAQRGSELTDGSYRVISKRGVKQHGMSDAEAGTQIRQELGQNKPSTASTVNAQGQVVDPYNPTGFQGASSGNVPGIKLRTEAERQARIAESPLSAKTGLVSSKRETGEMFAGGRDGNFSAGQSAAYAKKAQEGGFGSARVAGAPAPVAATPQGPQKPSATMTPTTTSWGGSMSPPKPLTPPAPVAPVKPAAPAPAAPTSVSPNLTRGANMPTRYGAPQEPAPTAPFVERSKMDVPRQFERTDQALGLPRGSVRGGIDAVQRLGAGIKATGDAVNSMNPHFATGRAVLAGAKKLAQIPTALAQDLANPGMAPPQQIAATKLPAKGKPLELPRAIRVGKPSGTAGARG